MAEVEISYKGSNIATMNASGTKTLLTEAKYLEDDVTITYARPSAPSGTKNISITANGVTTEDVTNYASAQITANVPNTYAAADEGKVVDDGTLVAQTSRNIDTNGTYDTTTNSEVTVNVSGGGGTPYYEPWNNSSFFERIGIQSNSGVEQIGTTGVYYATSTTRVSTRPIIDASQYGDEWYFIPLGTNFRFFVRLFDENLTEQIFSGSWVSEPTKYDFSQYNYKYIAWSISLATGASVSLSDYNNVMVLTRQVPSGSLATEYKADQIVDAVISGSRPAAAALNMFNALMLGNTEEGE